MSGHIKLQVQDQIGEISFSHPKANSLPSELLAQLEKSILDFGNTKELKAILIKSEGVGAFCAGASFDELKQLKTQEEAENYFLGFAKVILAIKNVEKIVITRVQGKAVGGGVGLIAASDYSFAAIDSSVRLSELSIGIGPFVIGPALERRMGIAAFAAMSLDCNWKDAKWCLEKGLFSDVSSSVVEMDKKIAEFLSNLKSFNLLSLVQLKRVIWEGVVGWESLLLERAKKTANCLISCKHTA